MFKVFLAMMAVLYSYNSFSGAPNESALTEKIQKINELAEELTKDYAFSLSQGGKEIKYTQRLTFNNCILRLETFNGSAQVQKEFYDLTKRRVNKKIIPFKGTYVIDFGLNTILSGRPTLHFSSKEDLEKSFGPFTEYVKLCHKSEVKKYYQTVRESISLEKPTEFEGSIPKGESIVEGSVYTEEHGNHMALLRGPYSFRERFKALQNAKKSIYLSQLFFRGDPVGLMFANQLVQKRMEGLDVRVMVTGLFNIIDNGDFKVDMENSVTAMRNMMAAGIRVHGVSCNGLLANSIRGIDIFRILTPSHIKNWLIDSDDFQSESAISISGGMNVSARYFRLGNRLQWIDQDIATKGPILSEMKDRFMADFYERELYYRTVDSDKKCLNTFDPIAQRKEYLAFKDAHTKPYKNPVKEDEIKEWDYIKMQAANYLQGLDVNGENLQALSWAKVQGARYIMGRPSEGENYLLKAHIDLVNSAKEEIIISNVFSLFVDDMKLALRRAVARGVKFRFLTNDPLLYKDLPMVNIMGRFYYRDLVYGNHKGLDETLDPTLKIDSSLVEISEWKGNLEKISPISNDTTMHNKYMIVDRKVGLVGSFNMDYASLKNPEQILLFENKDLANELLGYFNEDHNFAKKLSLEEINSFEKPKGTRFLLFISKLLKNSL